MGDRCHGKKYGWRACGIFLVNNRTKYIGFSHLVKATPLARYFLQKALAMTLPYYR
jgi:hypothetical protein